ncbi:hypothetical protein ES332_A05G216900v1 [Gossypium tomentosum]|uniref:DUF1645 domain-containing protein n=1 Tax=Gossypium tomentosum TaxID=34277 RepID=A0A5D2QIQ8_GOSTO|nr:hypothetical protein ES332_A05G216900v1 [Gossypium tomentosum]
MEVVIPDTPVMDFDFNSARSSPRSSAPSTPRRFGDCFFSAPTSPTRMSEFYREFDRFSMMDDRQKSKRSTCLAIPFDWEEKPGTPKSPRAARNDDDDDDFAFDFSEALEKTSLSAEELFDGGKIKPLKPPPRLQVDEYNQKSPLLSSPRSLTSPLSQGRKFFREAFSPRKKKDRDPFATAIETSRNQTDDGRRGRERVQDHLSKNSSRRATRSLSPYRVSEYPWEEQEQEQEQENKQQRNGSTNDKPPSLDSKPSLSSNKGSSRKWRLRDLLLFRSASEGHATDKYSLRKYSSSFFKKPEDSKNSSLKSGDRSGSGGSRRKASAHEIHYTTNKAVSENMKKKTFLPYKQGILGRLAFNPS